MARTKAMSGLEQDVKGESGSKAGQGRVEAEAAEMGGYIAPDLDLV